MKLSDRISNMRYEIRKRKQKKEEDKFNKRQEELDTIYKHEKQKSNFKSLLSTLKFETYTKRLVGVVVFIGLLDLQLSYVLAFLGKDQIAESLSTQICITLLGTVLVYVVRAYFDTKAEKRDEMIKAGIIVDKNSSIIPNEVIENKISEIISKSGLSEHVNIKDLCGNSSQPEDPDDSHYCG